MSKIDRWRAWLRLGCISTEELEHAAWLVAGLVRERRCTARDGARLLHDVLTAINYRRAHVLACMSWMGEPCKMAGNKVMCDECPRHAPKFQSLQVLLKSLEAAVDGATARIIGDRG